MGDAPNAFVYEAEHTNAPSDAKRKQVESKESDVFSNLHLSEKILF